MKHSLRPLVMGNWKMNPATLTEAARLFTAIKKGVQTRRDVDVVVAPPMLYLAPLATAAARGRVAVAAQTVSSFTKTGAQTGEVSMLMLGSVGCQYVIVGHSERRALGETDTDVQEKTRAVLAAKATAVVCVGEKARDRDAEYFSFVEAQVVAVLQATTKSQLGRLVIAYEPIWAIGTGKTATAADVQEMKLFIQKVIADTLGRPAVKKIRIIYGGSVVPDTADELLETGMVDGFLVGGASLKPADFVAIVHSANTYANAR